MLKNPTKIKASAEIFISFNQLKGVRCRSLSRNFCSEVINEGKRKK
jgi:hypothetical protein